MTTTYQPIACSLHDEYEMAIMHKKSIMISWLGDDGENRKERVLAEDILVKNKEEFLIARTQDDRELCLRLDKIILLD